MVTRGLHLWLHLPRRDTLHQMSLRLLDYFLLFRPDAMSTLPHAILLVASLLFLAPSFQLRNDTPTLPTHTTAPLDNTHSISFRDV